MLVKDILDKQKLTVSFEFFPPKNESGWDELFESISKLMPLKPSYVSVTYGAGGSTRDKTHDLVTKLHNETDLCIVAHLTCVNSTRDEVKKIIERYNSQGIFNILALRGDLPRGVSEYNKDGNGFDHAADLISFIKDISPGTGIGVAGFPEGHPQMPNRLKEIEYLKEKIDAGADYIVTQMFFDNRDFYDFKERCHLAGINVPVIAGIMPITSRSGMNRMAELAAGARFPAPLLKAAGRAEDEFVRRVGVQWATEQIRDLIDNDVDGIHLYTLNRSRSTIRICESLGITSYDKLY
ncbi:methylenetetrahydrofolate reductase [NAD(P)H] [Spirochaeta isovalerica]|uniref:Methylenetetrahydrofolate reductase n=1 Tax=Spirochaeta isovalerica TaxID=150 RepID=A0A841R7Z9_9SPIO|nr:methylenetetrahydrofolate reductase [NAD(P)H] [Spirochaeta isovalerica]MBB6478602.1 methylenetetrahydrofolate reductase (NADPH) [Spirochaeta isovalerica]